MSYAQAEFIVRYMRMRGRNVFYPMGFDDNGLPTERYVEQKYEINKARTTRSEFRALCLAETAEVAVGYERFWRKLGLLPRGAIVIARHGDRVDGVVVLAPGWAPNQAHRADVTKLLVHRRARSAGLGRRLMTALEDHARAMGFRLLTLDTRRGDAAERLYRRLGWCEVGVIPDYAIYGQGWCDTVVFYKRLAPSP